jgi:hypothetical protein
MMGAMALVLAFILYLIVALDLAINKKSYALAVVFLCYAIANLAYIWVGDFMKGNST